MRDCIINSIINHHHVTCLSRFLDDIASDEGRRVQANKQLSKISVDPIDRNLIKRDVAIMMLQEFHVLEINVNPKLNMQVLGPETPWTKVSLPRSQGFGRADD